MIAEHQPHIFPKSMFSVGLSSVEDGNMRYGFEESDTQVRQNRKIFIEQKCGGTWEQTNNVVFSAEGEDFTRYKQAPDDETGVSLEKDHRTAPVDGLYIQQPGRGLFLTIGDCGSLAIVNTRLAQGAISHVGRHSAEQLGAYESIRMLQRDLDWELKDMLVWVGPAVGSDTYPLHQFAGMSLHQVIAEQLSSAGLSKDQVEICEVDTAKSDHYYSHSEHIAGRASRNGRFSVYLGLHPHPEYL